MRQNDLDTLEISYNSWVEKMRDKLIFEHQKKALKVSRILRLYNILQKIKDHKKRNKLKDVTSKNEDDLPLFPGLLPYPHTIGAPAFKPTEEGVIRSQSQRAMSEQVQIQKEQILEQVKLLQKQYNELIERETISNLIYRSEIKFKPVPGHTYHLYLRDTGYFLSLIEPNQWGRTFKPQFVASIKLLYDLTWQVLDKSEQFNNFTNENLS